MDPVTGEHCEESPRNASCVYCKDHSPTAASDEGGNVSEDDAPTPVASRTRARLAAARLGPVREADRILDEEKKGGEVRFGLKALTADPIFLSPPMC